MTLTGIVLAGGKSSRMGQDKGLMSFQGKLLIDYPIEIMKLFTSQILISSNQESYQNLGYPVIPDEYPHCGPISGLHAALSASNTEWNLVLSCDTPYATPSLFQQMLPLIQSSPDAIIPLHSQGMEPLVAIYHKSMASFFEQKIHEGQYKLQKVLKERMICFFSANDSDLEKSNLFFNINTPQDFNSGISNI